MIATQRLVGQQPPKRIVRPASRPPACGRATDPKRAQAGPAASGPSSGERRGGRQITRQDATAPVDGCVHRWQRAAEPVAGASPAGCRPDVPVSGADIQGKAMDLEGLAATLGISKNVRFIEWPENVDEWISACDLIVAPFLSDRFSSVNLLEAMAMGKPVIATDVGEQREIIDHDIDGYLVSPGDVKEMAARILQLLTNPEALDQMSRCARAKAEHYSADAYVGDLQRLYGELATKGRSNQTEAQRSIA